MQITSGTQVAIGAVGYIVSFDISDYDMSSIEGVQAKKTAGVWSSPATVQSAYGDLALYIDSATAPDIAFNWMKDTLFVFVKSAYTYATTTLVTFWGYRNAQDITTVADIVDIPGEMEQLALSLIIRRVYLDNNISIPQNINQQIRTQCTNLNITYPI